MKWFKKLFKFGWETQNPVETYLANSVDLVDLEQRQKAIIPFHSSTDAFIQFNYVHILQVLGYEDVEFIATVTNGLIQTRLNGYCAQ